MVVVYMVVVRTGWWCTYMMVVGIIKRCTTLPTVFVIIISMMPVSLWMKSRLGAEPLDTCGRCGYNVLRSLHLILLLTHTHTHTPDIHC